VQFSLARAGGLRRITEMPNPLAQLATASLCAANWRKLQAITSRSPLSLSRPVKRRSGSALRAVCELPKRAELAISRMPGGAVTLQTDISQFYPSIYTHAVDWAIRGKAAAKKARRSASLGAQLDARLRQSRSGQTVGLSIGPETSWLVAELILARVDEAMCKQYPCMADRAYRVVDDLTFYAQSVGEAQEVLSFYQRALAEYELILNPTKVSILDGLRPPEPDWVSRLRQARYRDSKEDYLIHDMVDLFAWAFEASRESPTDGVLSYAIKRCNPFPAGPRSWPIYRDLVLATITQEPSTLRHVYQILVFARAHAFEVDNDRLVEVLNQLCEEHARLDHGYEVSWILTTLRELNLPLDSRAAQAVAKMNDNCCLILLMDMCQTARRLRHVDMDAAVRRAEAKGALSTSDWLLAYEFRAAKWCPPKKWDDILQWRELNKAAVRFLVSKPATGRRLRITRKRPAFLASWGYA